MHINSTEIQYLAGPRFKHLESQPLGRGSPIDPRVIEAATTRHKMIMIGSLSGLAFSIVTITLVSGPTMQGMAVLDALSAGISNVPGYASFILGAFTLAALAVELISKKSVSMRDDIGGSVTDDRRKLMLEAEHWIGKGLHAKALKVYDRILEKHPQDIAAMLNKGFVYDELGKYKEAISTYDCLIKSAPKNAKARYNKGIALIELGKLPEAFECFNEALKLDKNDLPSLRKICFILFSRQEYTKTIRFCDRILSLDKSNIDIIIMKGKALEHKGKVKEALKHYERALKIDPNDEWALQCKHELLQSLHMDDGITE